MAKESFFKPFYTVLVLAFVCSFLVSLASVGLRPRQEANRLLERKKNILLAAGLFHQDKKIDSLFSTITTKIVHLKTGDFVPESEISVKDFDQLASINDINLSQKLAKEKDIAGIRRLEKYSLVYLVTKDNRIDKIVFPIRGKGLWSTMYGYVALENDMGTICGLSFYEHGETPGLGGEIENPVWLKGWQGKKLFNPHGEMKLKVVKGESTATGEAASYEVDGLSGATLTGDGIEKLFHFWFDQQGFKPFLHKLKQEVEKNG